MKFQRLITFICTFSLFIFAGLVCSNIQSQIADQVLQSRGMSMESRKIEAKKDMSISQFIEWLNKEYPKKEIQLQLASKYESHEILIWAQKRNLTEFPVTKGRFFTQDDFEGSVTMATVSPNTKANILVTQNNGYLQIGNNYYSIVGTLKNIPYQNQENYYLTTGVKQVTGQNSVLDYNIYIDGSPSIIKKAARYLHSKTILPEYVKRRSRQHYSIIIPEILLIVILGVVLAAIGAVSAFLTWRIGELSQVHGSLLRDMFLNKSWRYILLQILEAGASSMLLLWRAYYYNTGFLVGMEFAIAIFEIIVYFVVAEIHHRKKVNNAENTR